MPCGMPDVLRRGGTSSTTTSSRHQVLLLTQHGGAQPAVEGGAAALLHQHGDGAPHAAQLWVHRQPQPQCVERVSEQRGRHARAGARQQAALHRQAALLILEQLLEHFI